MTEVSVSAYRDFGLYGFKAFQDLLLLAYEKNDASTVRSVLAQLRRSLANFTDQADAGGFEYLRELIDQSKDGAERASLEASLRTQLEVVDAKVKLRTGRQQVLFGVAARGLELYLRNTSNLIWRALTKELIEALPTDLVGFVELFTGAKERGAEEFWGWHWWDARADGEAHYVDTETRPNTLFCVRALQILGRTYSAVVLPPPLPVSQSLAFLVDPQNRQNLQGTLQKIADESEVFAELLTPAELGQRDALVRLLLDAKRAYERREEDRLIAADLVADRVATFKKNVLDALESARRIQPLMKKLGTYVEVSEVDINHEHKSFGYNQLDDKGAFLDNWNVSYPSWGDQYGSGLAQSEDRLAFVELIERAQSASHVVRSGLIPTCVVYDS